MPTVEDEERIVEAIESGHDDVVVPQGLVDEGSTPGVQALAHGVAQLGVPQRIKLALRGNREVRMQLIRDNNAMIRRLVLRNPRISEEELLAIAQTRSADDELLRTIAESRDWTKSYQIRLALVGNPKTPLTIALKLMSSLPDRDLRRLAKSKNIPVALAGQAKRMVLRRPGGA